MNRLERPYTLVWVVVLSLASGALLVGGCEPTQRSPVVRLPDTPRLVGGGMMIKWTAPEPGTVYLVEKRTGKIVETRSLEEGEVYSFTATSILQADEFEEMLGIPFSRAQFQLYFEPAAAAGTDGETSEPEREWNRS